MLELARALAEPRARPASAASAGCRKAAQGTPPSDTRRKTARGLAVLTCSGGDSGVAADSAARLGIEPPPLGPATRGRLEALPPAATIANPLDYTAMIWGDADRLARIIQAVGDDAAIDQLLLCYDQPPRPLARVRGVLGRRPRGYRPGREAGAGTLVCSTLPDLIDATAIEELARRGCPWSRGWLPHCVASAHCGRQAPGRSACARSRPPPAGSGIETGAGRTGGSARPPRRRPSASLGSRSPTGESHRAPRTRWPRPTKSAYRSR